MAEVAAHYRVLPENVAIFDDRIDPYRGECPNFFAVTPFFGDQDDKLLIKLSEMIKRRRMPYTKDKVECFGLTFAFGKRYVMEKTQPE